MPPKPPKPPPAPAPAPTASADGFFDAGGGYALGLHEGRIVARNAKGRTLASVPKELKEGDAYTLLQDALDLLDAHAAECRDTVESWMLRTLPVPRAVIGAVWADAAWRTLLENTVVTAASTEGGAAGLLRGVDAARGLGVVTLDGDTVWITDETVRVPHPILLDELDDWRALLAEANLTQGLSQLFRETFPRPVADLDDTSIEEWSGGEFTLLAAAMGEARKGGWRVRGGAACCATWEGGRLVEARYDLGEGDPMYETTTGSLVWVDAEGVTLPVGQVGAVAWSEGMRMAATIYKKRVVETQEDGSDA